MYRNRIPTPASENLIRRDDHPYLLNSIEVQQDIKPALKTKGFVFSQEEKDLATFSRMRNEKRTNPVR
ncbi:MAG TPA: hypothetical protein EYH03_04070 [Chromatiales bacterium]|nr:hypothetical protein [Chromatiales bacterium]